MNRDYYKYIFDGVIPSRVRQENFRRTKKLSVKTLHDRGISIEGVIRVPKPVQYVETIEAQKSATIFKNPFKGVGKAFRYILFSKVALTGMVILATIPLAAFEAHVVNVTATIEGRPCVDIQVRSMGFWRNHSEIWILPQTLGSETVSTVEEVELIFDLANNDQANKLKKQLLALKFNIAYFGSGPGLHPDGDITLGALADQADTLLSQDPPASDQELEEMKDKVEEANTAGHVSTCPEEECEDQNGKPCPCSQPGAVKIKIRNNATVVNNVTTSAETGGNVAEGSEGGDGGEGGSIEDNEGGVEDSNAGDGGDGGEGSEGGTVITGGATATSSVTNIVNTTEIDVGCGDCKNECDQCKDDKEDKQVETLVEENSEEEQTIEESNVASVISAVTTTSEEESEEVPEENTEGEGSENSQNRGNRSER